MKRLIGLMLGVTFVAGITGSVLAQGQPAPATPAAPATAPKEKVEKPAEPKKPAAHNASGTVWTFAVDPKTTKIRKAGKDITAAELAAGDPVNVRYHEHDGKNVADSVMVRAPKKAAEAPKAEAPKKDEVKK